MNVLDTLQSYDDLGGIKMILVEFQMVLNKGLNEPITVVVALL